jgi:hypothetical protein
MDVELGEGGAVFDYLGNREVVVEKASELRGTLEDYFGSHFCDHGGIADELERVAEALFGVEEDGLALEWGPGPHWLWVIAYGAGGGETAAGLVELPAGGKIALSKMNEAQRVGSVSMCGIDGETATICNGGFVEAIEIVESDAEGMKRLGLAGK